MSKPNMDNQTRRPVLVLTDSERGLLKYTDDHHYPRETVMGLLRIISDLRTQLEVITGERDRQYEFNIGQIAKQAELEGRVEAAELALATEAAHRQELGDAARHARACLAETGRYDKVTAMIDEALGTSPSDALVRLRQEAGAEALRELARVVREEWKAASLAKMEEWKRHKEAGDPTGASGELMRVCAFEATTLHKVAERIDSRADALSAAPRKDGR